MERYAPFPELELEALAVHFENISKAWSPQSETGARLREEHLQRARVCREAVRWYHAFESGESPSGDVDDGDYIAEGFERRDDEPPNPYE
jgi:hypothetical protein